MPGPLFARHTALTVGTFVPRKFSGTVYSVHDHAINIKDDNDYRLISIVDLRVDLTGLSVLVLRLPAGTLQGQVVTISDGRLSILAAEPGSGASVSLRTAGNLRLFSGSISAGAADVSQAAVCGRLPLIRDELLAHGSPDGLRALAVSPGRATGASPLPSSPFVRRAFEVIATIDDDGPLIDLSGLVGLGIGFTPSGDDFIMGFLAAGAAAGGGAEVDRDVVRRRLRSTTLGGATLLRLALDGSFPAYMCDFMDGLRVADHSRSDVSETAAVSEAVIRAVHHGESSGTDALAGFVCGLTVICAAKKLDE